MKGKKLRDIAVDTGLRITTLRTQLSSLLKKVGAERQADLIRGLRAYRPVGPASYALPGVELAPILAAHTGAQPLPIITVCPRARSRVHRWGELKWTARPTPPPVLSLRAKFARRP
jgi:hypothetical protein